MLQPSPPQLSSFFTGASPLINGPSNLLNAGELLRNINVHVLSGKRFLILLTSLWFMLNFNLPGTSLAPSVSSSGARESTRDLNHAGRQNMEQASQTGNASGPLGNAAPMRGVTARTVVAAIPGRSPSENSGHVLSVVFPVHVGPQPSNPAPSTSSQHSHPSISSGTQPTTAVSVQHSSSESASVPQVVAQENSDTDHASSGSAPDQASGCAPAKSISDIVGQQLVIEGKLYE